MKNVKKFATKTLVKLKKYIQSLAADMRSLYTLSVTKIQAIPVWIKTRPEAIKQWKKQDRKKKKYRSFQLQSKIKPEPRYVPTSFNLMKDTWRFLRKHKKIFIGIFTIHLLIYAVFLRTPITTNINTIEDTVQAVLGEGSRGTFSSNITTLGAVLGSTSTNQSSGVASSIAIALVSLVYIWTIRELYTGRKIRVRDAYYQAVGPLFSAAMVVFVISLQLIPLAIAAFVYSTARTSGLFVSGFEDLAVFIVTVLISLLSFYWATSSIIALYIVTLPGMYPMQALRAAKKLVQFRRLAVFRRIMALPVVLAVLYLVILLGVIRFASAQVFIIVEAFPIVILPFIHVYLYKLYRSLI